MGLKDNEWVRNPGLVNNTVEHEDDTSVRRALKMGRFWYLGLILFLGTFYGCYLISVYKALASTILRDDILTLAGSLGSAFNGTSRIMWGTLQDKFGFKKVYYCLLAL